jgi:arylsulfatase A-like enzyme
MPRLSKTMKPALPYSKKSSWFLAILSGFFLSAGIYFWFLQPADIISRQRLLLAFVLWIMASSGLYLVFPYLQKRLRSSPNNIILGIILTALLSAGLFHFGIQKKEIPNNLFLIPRQTITIEIPTNEINQDIRLTGFYNGLSPVSYAVLKLGGEWETIGKGTLRHTGKEAAAIQYTGWMVAKHFIEFEKNPVGGEAVIRWNETDAQYIHLTAEKEQKTKFDYRFSIPKRSKNSVGLVTLISLFVILYPVMQLFINGLSRGRDLLNFERWFEETTLKLKKFTMISFSLCAIATVFLLITPLLSTDKDAGTIKIPLNGEKPNIFLIIVDALSAQDMSLLGYPLETTPRLKQIAQNWSVYANAHTPSVCSIGVYPSLISGHYPYILRPFTQYGEQIRSSDTWTDLFQLLKQNGYHTYWSGYLSPGFYHTGSGIETVFGAPFGRQLINAWLQMKPIRKQYFPYIPLSMQQPERYPSIQYDDYRFSKMMDLLNDDSYQSPFFLYLHFDGVHVMPGIEWIYPAGTFQGTFSNPEKPDIRDQYHEAMLNLDLQISKFVDQVKEKGIYDESMIILLADHGQVFREESLAQCSTEITLYETHVPLLIKYPHQTEGEWVSRVVSTIDLAPTVLDVLKIPHQPAWFDGFSLLMNPPGERMIFSGNTFQARYRDYLAVMDDSFKLVLRGDKYFLFNYIQDPDEKNNLLTSLGMDHPIVHKLMKELEMQRGKIF